MEAGAKQTLSVEQAELLQQIPSVDELLAQPRLAALAGRVDRNLLVAVTRIALAELRSGIAGDDRFSGTNASAVLLTDCGALERHVQAAVERLLAPSLQ